MLRTMLRNYVGVFMVLATIALMLTLPSVASAAPANDNFADAQTISGQSASVGGTTAWATREVGEPDHYTSNPDDADVWLGDHTVWFRWTAPGSGSTTIDTCTANIDSILAVYTGGSLDSLTRVADNNNDYCGGGWGSKVTFEATAGSTYQIAVGDAGGLREDTFTLSLQLADVTVPKVASVDPVGGTKSVARATDVTAHFSEPMDTTTLNTSTFKLFKVNADGTTTRVTNAPVTPSADGLSATLDPYGSSDNRLAKNTKYKAVVTTGAKDVAGNALDQNPSKEGNQQKSWHFTTGG